MPLSNSKSSRRPTKKDVPGHLGASWLLASGIQNLSSDKKLRGGVASWYEIEERRYPFLYSEITGYALSALIFLYGLHREKKYLERAALGADWLIHNALHSDGGVKTRFYLVKHYVSPNYCFHSGRIYAFDTAMVGYGLLQIYKKLPKKEYWDAVERIAVFLAQRMQAKDGTFYPYYDSHEKRVGEDLEKWSDQRGVFHAKLALFFIDYFRLAREESHKKRAVKLLDQSRKVQLDDGRFITGQKEKDTHLHPHAYALEGLLYGAFHLKRADYLDSVFKGFCWMLKGVSADGSVSSVFANKSFSHHERSDIVAQTLRIGAALYALKPSRVNSCLPILKKIKDHLLLFQFPGDKHHKQKGGFVYGAATDGLIRDHLNAWSTMFAVQAVWMYEEFIEKKKPLTLEHFI